jgi:hypothetical protein
MNVDQLDKDIKRSAMNIPSSTGRVPTPHLKGAEKDSLVKSVIEAKDVPINFDAVNIFNYPAVDECFDHMLVNFYYTNLTDPTTTILSYRVYTSGDITEA